MAVPDWDVLIVGAGLSGINAGYRLQTECPDRSYTILESRTSIGGTWDLFKYPGLRSDSDLHTFGFSWRPWSDPQAIAGGKKIVNYVKECAAIEGIDKHIQFQTKVLTADFSTANKMWTITVSGPSGEERTITAGFAILGTGYYDYEKPLDTKIPGIENFKGTIVHPQFWPEDLDYTNKTVAIIGSGATAITLLPNLCDKAKHVTMVQRSPSYILSRPSVDPMGSWMHKWLPKWLAFKLVRWKFLLVPFIFFQYCRAFPASAKRIMALATRRELPKDVPLDPHFLPSYNPWEQRLCICPDADFYKCLRSGKADIVTGNIASVTENSIKMQGPIGNGVPPQKGSGGEIIEDAPQDDNVVLKGGRGETLHPDIIVTATGLRILLIGGIKVTVDGVAVDPSSKFLWKGIMLQDVPNAAVVLGYTNASWTLGADATAIFVCRLLKHMKSKGYASVSPYLANTNGMKIQSPFNLSSTYVNRALKDMPKTGNKGPWKPRANYMKDLWMAKHGSLSEGLRYKKA